MKSTTPGGLHLLYIDKDCHLFTHTDHFIISRFLIRHTWRGQILCFRWQILACWHQPLPNHLPPIYQWSFLAHLISVIDCPVKPALIQSWDGKSGYSSWSPQAMVGMKVFCFCFFYIITSRQTKTWFYMCREALYTVLCNTLLQKKNVSVGKVGALKKNVFSSLRVLLPFFRWSELCQKNLILIFIYLLHAFLPFLLFPFFNCALCWMCEAVNILIQVIVCVELCNCVIKNEMKYQSCFLIFWIKNPYFNIIMK